MPRRVASLAVLAVCAALLSGCQTEGLEIESFEATLSGANEVPSRTTPAQGSATFQAIGGTVSWTLSVSGISNVTAAHIHGPASTTENAGVIVTLVPSGPLTGTRTGSFSEVDEGSATVGTVEALLQLMRSGRAYVNVHTSDGVAPPDTGPGDFPGGEIRGQIAPR